MKEALAQPNPKRVNRGLFSSDRKDWETPIELFRMLDAEFGFELDVCALPTNAKCAAFFSPQVDGLRQQWGESVG